MRRSSGQSFASSGGCRCSKRPQSSMPTFPPTPAAGGNGKHGATVDESARVRSPHSQQPSLSAEPRGSVDSQVSLWEPRLSATSGSEKSNGSKGFSRYIPGRTCPCPQHGRGRPYRWWVHRYGKHILGSSGSGPILEFRSAQQARGLPTTNFCALNPQAWQLDLGVRARKRWRCPRGLTLELILACCRGSNLA
jgi:hypothetical protein